MGICDVMCMPHQNVALYTDVVTTTRRTKILVWTDDEIKLLLRVTLDYKTTKYQENINWESCHSKYGDITSAIRKQYLCIPKR